MWRKASPLTLLMGMYIDTATTEDSVEISLKLGIKLPYDSTIPLLAIYPEETITEKNRYTPVFITALFIIEHGSNLDVHLQKNG